MQPGWLAHSTELSVEHWATVPAQAVQAQPGAFEQAIEPVFESQGNAVPPHELPFQLQPAAWLQSGAETCVEHSTGAPVQAGVQVQAESPHAVAVASAEQAVGTPAHDVVKAQPAILPQSVALAAELQSFGVPAQLLVEEQPFALPHCCAERLEQTVALPLQT